jgi:hypothetical protein
MSTKRSDRLRSLISATVADAAADTAPVTITGASLAGVRVAVADEPITELIEKQKTVPGKPLPKSPVEEEAEALPASLASAESKISLDAQPIQVVEIPTMPETPVPSVVTPASVSQMTRTIHSPISSAKKKTWEKISLTLEEQDLRILDDSDRTARVSGLRLRRGGNPSLFVRAGLRLLEQLRRDNPEAWLDQVSATIPGE